MAKTSSGPSQIRRSHSKTQGPAAAPPLANSSLTNQPSVVTIGELHPCSTWACGAAGSALPWHGRGHRFDPDQVHQSTPLFLSICRHLRGSVSSPEGAEGCWSFCTSNGSISSTTFRLASRFCCETARV